MFTIQPIESLSDNYIWCLAFEQEKHALVVDPGDAAPVLAHLKDNNLTLAGILVTHHHKDHTGGIQALLDHKDVPVYGPQACKHPTITQHLAEGDRLNILGLSMHIHEVPAHTLDHIFYKIPKTDDTEADIIFCGDTLFRAGCGRLFEGSPEQLMAAMELLKSQPEDTVLYPTHEYSLANLAFAAAVEPLNVEVQSCIQWCEAQRADGKPTLPTTVAEEKQINPFMRFDCQPVIDAVQKQTNEPCDTPADVVKLLRRWKDHF